MPEESFEIGAVVMLKSGGPTMTVTRTGRGPQGKTFVSCVWFVGEKTENGSFPPEALMLAPEKSERR